VTDISSVDQLRDPDGIFADTPSLPEWLPDDAVADLAFAGNGSISVEVLRRTGELDLVVRL
jgi:hypothetical protein